MLIRTLSKREKKSAIKNNWPSLFQPDIHMSFLDISPLPFFSRDHYNKISSRTQGVSYVDNILQNLYNCFSKLNANPILLIHHPVHLLSSSGPKQLTLFIQLFWRRQLLTIWSSSLSWTIKKVTPLYTYYTVDNIITVLTHFNRRFHNGIFFI